VPPPSEGDLTIVVPVYNEADNIKRTLAEVERHVPQPFTLYVVYDFDEDTTVPVVKELQADRPWLQLHKNDIGRGVVNALKAGFELVESGPVIVIMGDLSDDISIVPRMLELYREGFHIVVPSRYMPGGQQIGGPLLKKTMSRVAGVSLQRLVGFPTADATNNFRLYDARIVKELGIESVGGFEVALEITAKAFRAGYRACELPVTWRDREAGESRFQLRKWLPHYLKWYAFALTGRRLPIS
jgi:glycosyltransferase involved in cell wall biosynthesis